MLRRLVPSLLAFAVVAAAYLTGGLDQFELGLMDTRFDLTGRSASGEVVVVAIDPDSLARLDTWPWPRGQHARLIDRLADAGARTVALDIDFSSRSSPAEDEALARSIARDGGRMILPVFRQRVSTGDDERTRATGPIAAFADHARLASVTVRPEDDGLVRRAPMADRYRDRDVPSLAALLAGRTDAVNGPFYIDFGIDPDTVPVLSYADVLAGRFDPRAVEGKTVVVGATAVELGDKFAVPLYRSLPGAIVQVLAYESLAQGRDVQRIGPIFALLVSLLVAAALGHLLVRRSWRWGAFAVLGVTATALVGAVIVQNHAPISLDSTPAILTAVLCFTFNVIGEVESQARELIRQGLEVLTKGAMLRGIVDNSFDGIAITDERGIVEIFNRSACDMLGCNADDAIGRPIGSLLPLPFPLPGENAAAALDVSQPIEIDVQPPGRERLTLELVTSTSAVRADRARAKGRSNQRRILMFTFRDATERRRAREAQRRALEAAIAANRAKSDFLSNMSHELRTPLNAIIGFSGMMKDQIFGPHSQPHYAEYARDIFESGSHLLAVVNDILDVSKVEAGKIEPADETVEIGAIVASSFRFVGTHAEAGGIRLVAAVPPDTPALRGDERLLKQTLVNLLSNAVKFTPRGGTVTLEAMRESDGGLSLRISDTGIGIAPEHIANLGQPFFQVDSSLSRSYEGTGLGLYLVAKFIGLHDGTIAFDSEPGRGTTVTLRFPKGRVVAPDWVATIAAVA